MAKQSDDKPGYRELQGELTAAGLRFAVVVSRFSAFHANVFPTPGAPSFDSSEGWGG